MGSPGRSVGRSQINEQNFRNFLAVLDADQIAAAEKYALLHRKLEFFFRVRNCEPAAAELADITLNRVISRFFETPDVKSADPRAFAYGVARLVLREHMRRQPTVNLDENAPSPALDLGEPNDLVSHLDACLEQLKAEERQLIVGYYDYQNKVQDRRRKAIERGKSQDTLRVQLCRLRKKLKTCMESRLRREDRV